MLLDVSKHFLPLISMLLLGSLIFWLILDPIDLIDAFLFRNMIDKFDPIISGMVWAFFISGVFSGIVGILLWI